MAGRPQEGQRARLPKRAEKTAFKQLDSVGNSRLNWATVYFGVGMPACYQARYVLQRDNYLPLFVPYLQDYEPAVVTDPYGYGVRIEDGIVVGRALFEIQY